MEELQQAMQRMASLVGGADGDGGDLLGDLDDDGGGNGNLKARVREQMAQMMNKRRATMGSDLEDDLEF